MKRICLSIVALTILISCGSEKGSINWNKLVEGDWNLNINKTTFETNWNLRSENDLYPREVHLKSNSEISSQWLDSINNKYYYAEGVYNFSEKALSCSFDYSLYNNIEYSEPLNFKYFVDSISQNYIRLIDTSTLFIDEVEHYLICKLSFTK